MSDRVGFIQRFERSLSLLVGIAAIVAASVSLYQASLAREQARAAAWPYLTGGSSLATGQRYYYVLANRGIGPARVRSVRVAVDGKDVASWTDAIRQLSGTPATSYEYSYVGPGSVMSPATADTLLTLPAGAQAYNFWRESGKRLDVAICYCSVYDECWVTGTRSLDAEPVKRCPPVTGTAFTQ
jgi:hypothetical protein